MWRPAGSNVQFAIRPRERPHDRDRDGSLAYRVLQRSLRRRLAFPIAKAAAKLAVGYTLDEIVNDTARVTPACFEPSIDYCVVKVPRFAFEKFQGADDTLTTRMKAVGEVMAIGRTFEEALAKALRSLQDGHIGLAPTRKEAAVYAQMSDAQLEAEIARPSAERIFHVAEGFRRGLTKD